MTSLTRLAADPRTTDSVTEDNSQPTSLIPRPTYTSRQLNRNLAVSTADAATFGVMVGIGETFLPAFALAVGLGEVMAGLVASVPLLAGGLIQLATPWVLSRFNHRQAWVVGASTVQALAFVPLIIAACVGTISGWGLLLVASIYWAGGLAGGPAWNSWIEQIVPRTVRAGYFAKRTRATQIATLCGFVGGGLLLQYGRGAGWVTTAFAVLFLVAFLFRMISVVMLAAHKTPPPKPALPATRESTSATAANTLNGRHLLIYLVMVQGVVQISGPFFTPYMLKKLEMSYVVFTLLVAVAFTAKVVSLAAWGKVAKNRGAAWLLTFGAFAIVPLSSLWTVSQSLPWLIFIQAINGCMWAAYELGFLLLFFEALPQSQRVKMLTYYNFANTASWCLGASIGALLLSAFEASIQGYHALFYLSSLGRGVALIYLLSHRPVVIAKVTSIGLRVLGLRPNGSSLESPILASIPEPAPTSEKLQSSGERASAA
ncbi:MAG: MFS transporter [Pirellulaceae bacterium]|nr:MFS transporter [Pirellulaceae bacterium]